MLNYTNIGKQSGFTEDQINKALPHIEWIEIQKNMSLPFMQGEAINKIIQEFQIPRVSHISYRNAYIELQGNEIYNIPVYGIRGHYKNGTVNFYVADNGVECTPIAVEIIKE